MKSHSSWLRTALFSALAIALVTACALPVSPRSVEHPRGAKVVLRTPYGPAERGSGFGALSYQSTVMPVNLALVIDHFEVNLLGTGTLPDRPSEIVAWSEARQFVFEDVPAGTWTVQVEAFDANSRRIALGTYPSSVVVADDQVTSVPASIAVSPLRSSGSVTGDFQLTLREVPAEVDAVHLSLQAVALETDGSFSLTDVLSTNPTLVSGSLSGASGTPQVVSITGSNLPTGSYVLGVEFHRSDVADLKSTFSPQFTVEIYDNLESTLDVNLTTTATVAPSTPPNNPSVTLDANGDAVLHWNAVATSSHIQVALAVNPLVATPPTSAGELQGITTLPNYGFLNAWNSGITVGEQPSGQVRFWVRSIISGMYPSPWTSVLATQRVYYVRSDGGDGNAGTKNSPLATLQEAINRLQTGGTTTLKSTVHMAGGTYPVTAPILNATRDVPGTPAGMEQPVPITILGGWDPTFAVRDPATTPTVLDDTRSSTSVGDESILRFDEATAVASPLTTPQMIDGLTFRMTNDAGSATRQGLLFQGAMNVTLSNLTFQMQGVSGTSLEAMRVEPWQDSLARSIMVYGNTVTLRAAVPASHTTDMTGLSLFTASPFSALFVSVHNNVFDLGPTQGSISRAINDQVSDTSLSPSLAIRNNTIVTSLSAPSPGKAPLSLTKVSYVSVENNLFYNKTPGAGFAIAATTLQESILVGNNVFEGFGTLALRAGGADYSLANAATPFSVASADNLAVGVGDIVFVNPAGDYHVTKVRSGGLQTAPTTWMFTNDHDGNPRANYWTPGAYQQTSTVYHFTSAGASGRFGPNQAQLDTAYFGTSLDSAVVSTTNNGTPGIQRWVVPVSGTYRIEAFGAQGAVYSPEWGQGAVVKGDFALATGDVLWILVGQQGVVGTLGIGNYGNGGGGGGTFIGVGATLASATPLLVAGGGGASGNAGANAFSNGNTGTDGYIGGNSTGDGDGTNNDGGSAGSAGERGLKQSGYPNSLEVVMDAAAGWSGNGVTSQAFLSGGAGAEGDVTRLGAGGFGGGGSLFVSGLNNYGLAYAGGGGGYSGGAASDGANGSTYWGGGGGSYNAGTNTHALGGLHPGAGLVVISRY